jgi:NAD(P)-dependent dehydrogenase (short-subunit alcohol dehydrogenase family)
MSSPTAPYAAAHENPQGEGDARPTALQIIHDEGLVNKLTDKVFLVTGTSSGIGVETVRALHATGAHVFMQARDMKKAEAVLKDILATSQGTGKLELLYMELGSLKSIREGVAEFLKKSDKLNVLVNNAGKSHSRISYLRSLTVVCVLISFRDSQPSRKHNRRRL